MREQVAGGTLRFGRRQIGTINAPCGKHLEYYVSGDSGSQPDWFQAMAKSRGVCYSAHVHAGCNSVSLLIVERPRKRDYFLRAFSMNPSSFRNDGNADRPSCVPAPHHPCRKPSGGWRLRSTHGVQFSSPVLASRFVRSMETMPKAGE